MSNVLPLGVEPIQVQHNRDLELSDGGSRQSTNWKKKVWSVAALYGRLSRVLYTQETVAEYRAMSRDQQGEAKDVGGFVGGRLRGQRRQATAVEVLNCAMLDADQATEDFLLMMDLQNFSWFAYTTHSHDPENGKFKWRVVIPYSRPVTPDEHSAIARRLGEWVGMDYLDPTTFQPHRLFYWPSAPADGPFEWQYADLPLLDVDAVLRTYGDYRNVSEWPVSVRLEAGIKQDRGRAGDPATKAGLVGAFCRIWSVPEAMDHWLPGVYEPAGGDRYTYVSGTSRAGAVVYDDGQFLYSHHGTDPAAMKCLNAWDLVRVHRHGHLDEAVVEGTPINKLPSQAAMTAMVQDDPDIKRQLVEERLGSAREDFPGAGDAEPGVTSDGELDGDAWIQQLSLDKHGQLRPTRENYELVLLHDPKLAGKIRLDRFSELVMGAADLPWLRSETSLDWSDRDDGGLRGYIEKTWGVPPQWVPLLDAFHQVALRQAFHPVQDYLLGLKWDEEERLDRVLVDYLGAEDTPYTRAVGRKFMVSAVARVMRPGCKVDHTLMLVGKQGTGKSAFAKVLGGDWYSDSLPAIGNGKDAFEALRGSWIIEIAEMSATRRADVEAVKHFLTKQADRYRVAYGRNNTEFKRQCVFLASTNEDSPLVDTTGNRRYWPVKISPQRAAEHWVPDMEKNRDQLWAEVVYRYQKGEKLYLTDEVKEYATAVQEQHRDEDPWLVSITRWLDEPIPEDWRNRDDDNRERYLQNPDQYLGEKVRRDRVTVADIWEECLRGRKSESNLIVSRRVNAIMKSIPGWEERKSMRILGTDKRARGFVRSEVLPGENC